MNEGDICVNFFFFYGYPALKALSAFLYPYCIRLSNYQVSLRVFTVNLDVAISYWMFAFRFTLILPSKHAHQKQQPKSVQVRRRSERSSTGSSDCASSSTNSQLFPKHCFACKKDRKQHNKKDEYPHLIKTKIGDVSVKLAAKEKMPSFYYENKDEDLIARELKCHRSCYNKFRLSSVGFDDISDNADFREYQWESNYNSVTDYVTEHILNEKRAVSIAVLHTIYGLKPNDTSYHSKLKSRLKKDFPTLSFLNIGRNSPDVVIDGAAEFDEITFNDKEGCLTKAENLLSSTDNKHRLSEFSEWAAYSFASDLMGAVARGKTITAKQYLLALGIHNITGQKKT